MTKYQELYSALDTLDDVSTYEGVGKQKAVQRRLKDGDSPTLRWLLSVAEDKMKATSLKTLSFDKLEKISFDLNEEMEPSRDDWFIEDFKKQINEAICKKAHTQNSRDELLLSIYRLALPISLRNILIKVITRTLNIGIGIKVINKAFGETIIPDRSVMLISEDKKKWDRIRRDLDLGHELVWEYKWDGVRVTYWRDHDCFYTRNFRPIPSKFFPELSKKLRLLTEQYPEIILDGELELRGERNRKKISGQVNSILKGKGQEGVGDDWVFTVFDAPLKSAFDEGLDDRMFSDRSKKMMEVLHQSSDIFHNKDKHIKTMKYQDVSSVEEIEKAFESSLESGLEGIIVKYKASSYEIKRSKKWIRFKAENTIDLRVVGVFPGTPGTKREATMGGFICQSSCGLLNCYVGSGFSDEDLLTFSKMKDDLNTPWPIVEVKYNELIQNKKSEQEGTYSLYLPRFIKVREDKNVADTIENLI